MNGLVFYFSLPSPFPLLAVMPLEHFTSLDVAVHLDEDIAMKGRDYLPGSREPGFFPDALRKDAVDPNFPKIYSVAQVGSFNSAEQAGDLVRDLLDKHLTEYGAILIRGLPIKGVDLGPGEPAARGGMYTMSELFAATKYTAMKYVGGGAKRREVEENVYSASDREGRHCMSFHQVRQCRGWLCRILARQLQSSSS